MSEHPLATRWRVRRAEGRPVLVAYLTAGFPDQAATVAALRMLAEEDVDVIELGLPFSDPLADGPVIQRACQRALERGATVRTALEALAQAAPPVPVVLFTYLNPVLAYGPDRLLADGAAAGACGLLVTDLSAGDDPDLEQRLAGGALALVRLVAPTTPPARLARMAFDPRGFVYLIARLGVTGTPTEIGPALAAAVGRVRAVTDLPVAVGFGIRQPAQARAAAGCADGVVVGSALVERLAESLPAARSLTRALRDAL